MKRNWGAFFDMLSPEFLITASLFCFSTATPCVFTLSIFLVGSAMSAGASR